jgi:hypothetical protein
MNNSDHLYSDTLKKIVTYHSSLASLSFTKKEIIIENNQMFDLLVDPVTKSVLCFPLINSQQIVIGVMQCIRKQNFFEPDKNLANVFSQKFF